LDAWEKFNLEDRGNGNVAFKSHVNTYLTADGDQLVWRDHPEHGNELFRFDRPHVQTGQGFNSGGFNAQQGNQGWNQNQGFNNNQGFNQNQGWNQNQGQGFNNNQHHQNQHHGGGFPGFQGGFQGGFK